MTLKEFSSRIKVLLFLKVALVFINIPTIWACLVYFSGGQRTALYDIAATAVGLDFIIVSAVVVLLCKEYLQQKDLFERLLELEHRYCTIVNNSPVIVWAVDGNRKITMFEGKGVHLTGHISGDMIGKKYEEFFTDPHGLLALSESYLGSCIERDLQISGGWYKTMFIPTNLEDGSRGVIGISLDISDRKISEEEAMRANQAKSRFLANMSHEIRTPIGIISGFSDLALCPKISSEERLALVAKIKNNSSILIDLVNSILDLSKIEAGKLEIETQEWDLMGMLREMHDMFHQKCCRRGIDFQIKILTPLPRKIVTDRTRVRQILMNLLGNALKFTDKGFIQLKVSSAALFAESSHLEFQVEDSGIGISPSQAKRLFQPFTQADSSMARKYGGTGLGLALSKKLARGLNGDLKLKASKIGQGSIFSAGIICEAVGTETFSAFGVDCDLVSDATAKHVIHLNGLKVLLVEDSVDNQYLVNRMLKAVGAQVEVAGDGAAGVKMAQGDNFDVILMDIQMPEMDGFAATKVLRSQGYKKKIIALTANALKEERDKAMTLGFDDYLTKPIHWQTLLKILSADFEPALTVNS